MAGERRVVELVNDSPFEFGHLSWQVRPPRSAMVVVVKATYDLVAEGIATPAAEPLPVTGETPWDDETDPPLPRLDTDLAVFKPRGECLVAAHCHAPGGETKVCGVAFRVGPVQRRLAVFGERRWEQGLPTDPRPFERVPLRWDLAYGGPSSTENPVGIGAVEIETASGRARPVPQIEDPDHLVTAPNDRPPAAGWSPVPRSFPARAARSGTFDETWRRTRWPWLPDDFDWAHFLSAPHPQWIDGYWRGDEEVELTNLVRGVPTLRSRLPGLQARAFVTTGGTFREVPLRLDTITLDGDSRQATCVWRGHAEIPNDEVESCVERVFVTAETSGQWRSLDACRQREAELIRARDAEAGVDEEPPPPGTPATPAELAAAPLGVAAVSSLAHAPTAPAEPAPSVPSDPARGQRRAEAEARLSRAEGLAEMDLSGLDLRALPLAGVDLRGADLTRATLSGVDLRGAKLSDVTAEGALLAGALLNGATAAAAVLRGADLSHAILDEADLTGADLTAARVDHARFVRAKLVDAHLDEARGASAVFDGADLTGARALDGATLTRASFREALCDRANLAGALLDGADFWKARMERADLSGARCQGARFDGATARSARFEEAVLVDASALRADFMESRFEGADLSRADFRGANLFGSALWRARTDGLRVELANTRRTLLEG